MRKYIQFVSEMHRITDLGHAIGVLHWDTEVYLPPGGSRFRAQQISTLSGMAHGMFTEAKMGKLLNALMTDNSLTADEHRNVELTLLDYEREIKLDKAFVEKLSSARSDAFNKWVAARKASDFAMFKPALDTLVGLKRREAEMRRTSGEPYDALLDLYEPGLRADILDQLFGEAKTAILPMLRQLNPVAEDGVFLRKHYAKDAQWEFGLEILKRMGYDMQHGRQDISAHPFTISFSPEDVRVTTRIDEQDFANMTWSCIHEGGHALYEQGLPTAQYGLPLGSSASLGIHESQSRLWENHVGRSLAFWEYWYPILQEQFPQNLANVSLDRFYKGINLVAPNLIRTEADELHYHLHVIIRYELERDLINGSLQVDQLREQWNQKYHDYLGIEVTDDANGILQDVHWSHGSFGYFPTYSIGSFYAAQFFATAQKAIPDLDDNFRVGDYSALLTWLRSKIHIHGRRHDPEELCKQVTGKSLDVTYFVDYIRGKLEGTGLL